MGLFPSWYVFFALFREPEATSTCVFMGFANYRLKQKALKGTFDPHWIMYGLLDYSIPVDPKKWLTCLRIIGILERYLIGTPESVRQGLNGYGMV